MNALAELPTDGPGEVPRGLRHGPAPTDLGACLSLKHNCLADPKGYGHPEPPVRIRSWTFGTSWAQQVSQPSL
jgi:hypothetical protein